MAFLFSSEALLDYVAHPLAGRVATWAKTIPMQFVSASVISIGQVVAAINNLRPGDPNRQPLHQNLDTVVSVMSGDGRIRDVDEVIAKRWAALLDLDLRRANGTEVGAESRIVVATALAKGLTLVTAVEPWTTALAGHRLTILDPFKP